MIYEVTKDGQTYLVSGVSAEQLRKRMYEYIREQMSKGRKLASIQYCWCQRAVWGKAP